MHRSIMAAIAGLILAAPVPADAADRLPVQPVDATTFDVLPRGDVFEQDFWCAAGHYAARKLGAKSTTRIYRLSEPPRRAGQAVRFSVDPAGHASATGLNTIGGGDGSLSAASARNQCEVARQMRQTR
jgi:hypothetical protein